MGTLIINRILWAVPKSLNILTRCKWIFIWCRRRTVTFPTGPTALNLLQKTWRDVEVWKVYCLSWDTENYTHFQSNWAEIRPLITFYCRSWVDKTRITQNHTILQRMNLSLNVRPLSFFSFDSIQSAPSVFVKWNQLFTWNYYAATKLNVWFGKQFTANLYKGRMKFHLAYIILKVKPNVW